MNSIPVPYIPLTNDTVSKVKLWETFKKNTGENTHESASVPVSFDEYFNNSFMLAWDRSHAKDNGFKPEPSDEGSLSIHLRVQEPVNKTMTVIVMMSFNAVITFEGDRAYWQKI